MGFYELRDLAIPTIPWKEYKPGIELPNNYLWTIRSAVVRGNDLNLPRLIGKPANEAIAFADNLYKRLDGNGIVIYYPYFIAHKSGTLNVFLDKIVIEAIKNDLWNLVTNQDLDVSMAFDCQNNLISSYGNKEFLNKIEINQLLKYAKKISSIYRDELLEGNTILLEWSFASSCNTDKEPIDEPYLVFYEVRTTK